MQILVWNFTFFSIKKVWKSMEFDVFVGIWTYHYANGTGVEFQNGDEAGKAHDYKILYVKENEKSTRETEHVKHFDMLHIPKKQVWHGLEV